MAATHSTGRVALLLRGINVGGKNKLPMADVKGLLKALGAIEPVSYLQSGNVVCSSTDPELHTKLSKAIANSAKLDVPVMRRTGAELAAVIAGNPFPEQAGRPKNLHVAFLTEAPDCLSTELGTIHFEGAVLRHGDDELVLADREIYLSYAANSRNSSLAAVLRKSKLDFTARNWTTVCKLAELANT